MKRNEKVGCERKISELKKKFCLFVEMKKTQKTHCSAMLNMSHSQQHAHTDFNTADESHFKQLLQFEPKTAEEKQR